MAKKRRSRNVTLKLGTSKLRISPAVVNAVKDLRRGMNFYRSTRFTHLLETVYQCGIKAGVTQVFQAVERHRRKIS